MGIVGAGMLPDDHLLMKCFVGKGAVKVQVRNSDM